MAPVPLHLTEAERCNPESYTEGTFVQNLRSVGSIKTGERITVTGDRVQDVARSGDKVGVFRQDSIGLAEGDTIRITANGKTLDGHRLNNGSTYTVSGFTDNGDIRLNNDWVLPKDYGNLTHGYISTSHAVQGKTVDVALVAMGNQSIPAMIAEQFYVSASRGRFQTTIYVEDKTSVKEAITKEDRRLLASDLVPAPSKKFQIRLRSNAQALRLAANRVMGKDRNLTRQNQLGHVQSLG
jgi:hypothetical protein